MFSHTLPLGFARALEPIPNCLVNLPIKKLYNRQDPYTLRQRKDRLEIVRHRHQARVRGATILEDISPGVIFGRDEGICQLCKKPILKGFSMDHIVSITKGGQHTWQNVQASHFPCNASKG